jgi:hypothetical protein
MTNLYVFWRKVTDPPSPWTRLTRTNQYLRFNGTPANHWSQTGATTHTHPSASVNVGNSVHGGEMGTRQTPTNDSIMGVHNDHPVTGYSIDNSNNNNPPGWGLDIIYMDLATWESSVRSFPQGAIVMSNGSLVDPNLERYTAADGKYIVHAYPESLFGTTTPQSHTVSGTLGQVQGVVFLDGWFTQQCGDRAIHHGHTFSFASEAKYVEPRNLVTRLYHAFNKTSKAVAGTVVMVDGAVGANWEILTGWSGGNLKSGNSNPSLSGSDTHEQSLSGNSSTYNGPHAFSNMYYDRFCHDWHYHPITGTLAAASHVPSSRLVVPARLLYDLSKKTSAGSPQIIGLW